MTTAAELEPRKADTAVSEASVDTLEDAHECLTAGGSTLGEPISDSKVPLRLPDTATAPFRKLSTNQPTTIMLVGKRAVPGS